MAYVFSQSFASACKKLVWHMLHYPCWSTLQRKIIKHKMLPYILLLSFTAYILYTLLMLWTTRHFVKKVAIREIKATLLTCFLSFFI